MAFERQTRYVVIQNFDKAKFEEEVTQRTQGGRAKLIGGVSIAQQQICLVYAQAIEEVVGIISPDPKAE